MLLVGLMVWLLLPIRCRWGLAMAPAVRVRLNAMTAHCNQAALAANCPDVIFSRGVGRGADLRVCVAVGVLDVTRRRWGSALFNGFVAATSGRVAAGALPQDAAGPCISEGLGEGVA